ncbi:MAG: hypothetical protein QOJ44_459 [Acidimicrobiaceae bacterium]|nr:hypothetical protein [Acidimicrobiaceae bacterium]
MTISGIPRFQRFFRTAAGLHVDKDDLKRYTEFVNRKVYDLLLMAEATAEANQRDVVQPEDLPITKGLQQSIHEFEKLDIESEMLPIIEQLEALPPLDLELAEATASRLSVVAGGLSLALAHTIRIIDPGLKAPHADDWERAFSIFDLLY